MRKQMMMNQPSYLLKIFGGFPNNKSGPQQIFWFLMLSLN